MLFLDVSREVKNMTRFNKLGKKCIICKKAKRRVGSLFCKKCFERPIEVKILYFRESEAFQNMMQPGFKLDNRCLNGVV